MFSKSILVVLLLVASELAMGQQTAARHWNEALLKAIRNDFARPTIHARNLFHIAAGVYDAWAVYSPVASTYFLGNGHGAYTFDFEGVDLPSEVQAAREEAISYVSYRLIRFRFRNSPGWEDTYAHIDSLMEALGYDAGYLSEDYKNGPPAALGNYIAARIIDYGLQDGANEGGVFQNLAYVPVNSPLVLSKPGDFFLEDPNHWQPLTFETFIDQSGNEVSAGTPPFLSAEWGKVIPFALKEEQLSIKEADGREWWVYHDPGDPCYLDAEEGEGTGDYQWNFGLVVNWSSHLDPTDGVFWDISPGAMGNLNIENLPNGFEELRSFYKKLEGGDPGTGYTVNPKSQQPYEPQVVPRGDYTRVLAEFWADGPDSETPPGHWFFILNYVTDHPFFERKFEGKGEEMDLLEWEVKSYFALGGAMHDAAVTAWGIKGYYDYVRPISAVRFMAAKGQSTDESLPNYHLHGLQLENGYVELVNEDDPLAGADGENVGKIKVFAWRGHDYITTSADVAGVGWILAENWWPYQRPTFVTPPFAGYISGHSTFSRAAAKVLTRLTGDEYFPGGMAEFVAKKNEFLVFEEGPSMDVVLQWARYSDASDQCSLSRIWGGIHPPVDDIPGRVIGEKVGEEAFRLAKKYFKNIVLGIPKNGETGSVSVFPNPVKTGNPLRIRLPADRQHLTVSLRSMSGALILEEKGLATENREVILETSLLQPGVYIVSIEDKTSFISKVIFVK
ncbi:DUF6851 domain-containing protein [Negadavirga shengliensis]|uniref:DUF6851 domain-containing protein n=1 Tax=Negadavirga shengliensis TaxID=1389218 RepID=A0ABV9T8D4_9BACT